MKTFLLAVLSFSASLLTAESFNLEIPRYQTLSVVLDGNPEEAVWTKAGKITEFRELRKQTPAQEKTEILLMMDSQNLHIGLRCNESSRITLPKPGQSVWDGDSVELFFASDEEPDWYRHLVIAPDGSSYSELFGEKDFQYKTRLEKNRWTAEIKIPLKKLGRFNGKNFRFNALRTRSNAKNVVTWAPVSRGVDVHVYGKITVIPAAEDLLHGPWTCCVRSSSAIVRWETAGICSQSLSIREKNTRAFRTVPADVENFILCRRKIHTVVLEGLKPGTEYEYRIGDSPLLMFTTLTEKSGDFSFAMVNDIHSHPWAFENILKRIKKENCDFLILEGDMVSGVTGKNIFYDAFLDILNREWKKTFFFLRGNHEIRGSFTQLYFDLFADHNRTVNFCFSHKGIFFICLDNPPSGVQRFGNWKEEQVHFLKQAIASPEFRKAEYRLLFCHTAFLLPGGNADAAAVCRSFSPEELKGIDAMFSGHAHYHARYVPGQKTIVSNLENLNGQNVRFAPPFPVVINALGHLLFRKHSDRLELFIYEEDGSFREKLLYRSKKSNR